MANPIYADFHVHTHLSLCGKPEATAEAMIRRAQEKGLARLALLTTLPPIPSPAVLFTITSVCASSPLTHTTPTVSPAWTWPWNGLDGCRSEDLRGKGKEPCP